MGRIKEFLFARDLAPDGTLAFRVLDRETGKQAIVCPGCMDDPKFLDWFTVGEGGPEPMSALDLESYSADTWDVPRATIDCACCAAEILIGPRLAR
jgi:hypothetical protein